MRERLKSVRCTIYTRKSTEEGLEQDFNSLHAQREACEAFIASQKHEGWTLIETPYDDGGFSGGSMDRPALRRLLEDVRGRKVDAVVVYKVDRLTRSLTDFARIVETFDAHGVSFVSVTQAFNTTTSMGRLTLNVLLSFAQFEREVTGERIRDKVAASKRKGLWMGGFVPTGYKAKDRSLVIDPKEAAIVGTIYDLYLKLGNVKAVHAELAQRKVIRPKGITSTSRTFGGRQFSRGQIYRLLSNPIYVGEIEHKGVRHKGQHAAIIKRSQWDAVQQKLAQNTRARLVRSNTRDPSLLAGILYDAAGRRMTPTRSNKRNKQYRYYEVRSEIGSSGSQSSPKPWRIPAGEIEGAVIGRLRTSLLDRNWLIEAVGLEGATPSVITSLGKNGRTLAERLASASGSGLRAILLDILQRIILGETELRIDVKTDGLKQVLSMETAAGGANAEPGTRGNQPARRSPREPDAAVVTLSVAVEFKRRGVETKLILEGEQSTKQSRPDPALIKAIARAHVWFEDIVSGQITITKLAAREGMTVTSVGKLLHLAFLAPDIVEAILAGNQPATTVSHQFIRSSLPTLWRMQQVT